MEAFATFLLNFVYVSAILALVALGLAMVFGLLGVMNMAHGEFVMLGAYSAYVVQTAQISFFWAIKGKAVEWGSARKFVATGPLVINRRQFLEYI